MGLEPRWRARSSGDCMTGLDRPIFVVGAPRSGTTLVQCILSANSQAYSLPETHFFSVVLPALGVDFDAPLDGDQFARLPTLLAVDAELAVPAEVWRTVSATPTPREVLLA